MCENIVAICGGVIGVDQHGFQMCAGTWKGGVVSWHWKCFFPLAVIVELAA